MANLVTGLDIGSDSVKLVQLKQGRGNSYKVVTYGMAEIQVSHDSGETGVGEKSPIAEAIKRLFNQAKIYPSNLIVNVPKQAVVVRYITLPTNNIAEVQQMIRFEAAKYVPFYTDEDIVDFELLGSSPLGGSEILLVVCRRDMVQEQLNLLRSLHIEPFAFDAGTLALMRALRFSDAQFFKEPNKNHLVIDLGAGSMEMSLIQNRVLKYTRSTTIGSSLLMKSLQEKLGVDEKTSRKLILQLDFQEPDLGLNTHPANLVEEAIAPWVNRLDNEIKRSLDYFSTEFGATQIHTVYLSGGLVRMETIKPYLEKELGLPVKLLHFVSSPSQPLPELNTAFGLALRKPDASAGESVNLLPPEVLQKRVSRKRQILVGLAGIGVIALLIGLAIYAWVQYGDMERQIKDYDKLLNQMKPKAEKLAEMQKQLESIRKMVNRTDVGVETLAGLSVMDMIPSKVTLERFSYERNRTVNLTVVCMTMEDAVEFRFAVEKLGLFSLVEIQNANTDVMEGKPVVRFTVACKIKPSTDDMAGNETNSNSDSNSSGGSN